MVGALDKGGGVSNEGLIGLRMNMEHGEWVELATGDESVVGDR